MEHHHAVVWIDHDEAHVLHFNPDETEKMIVRPSHRNGHLHHKNGQMGAGRTLEDHRFYGLVVAALVGAKEILVVGPDNAKDELEKHMKQHAGALAACIVGMERVDPPMDGQLLTLARKYFKAADRLVQRPMATGH